MKSFNYIENIDSLYIELNRAIHRIKNISPNDIDWDYELCSDFDIIYNNSYELELYCRALKDKLRGDE